MGGAIERPSTRYRRVEVNSAFQVSVPDNWSEFRAGTSVTIAPEGAYGNVEGQSVFTHGAIVGVSNSTSRDLNRDSDQLISGILDGNAYLNVTGRYQRLRIDGRDALRMRLSGTSPITNRREIVDVYTAFTSAGHLFHVIQVVPANDQGGYRAAFDEMVRSARIM
jgi:hypothetical protein